jgi:hypothetical protein
MQVSFVNEAPDIQQPSQPKFWGGFHFYFLKNFDSAFEKFCKKI